MLWPSKIFILSLQPKQENSLWASYKDLLADSSATYQIKDFVCDEFKQIVEAEASNLEPAVKYQRMSSLFKMLDESWENYQVRIITKYLCFTWILTYFLDSRLKIYSF